MGTCILLHIYKYPMNWTELLSAAEVAKLGLQTHWDSDKDRCNGFLPINADEKELHL